MLVIYMGGLALIRRIAQLPGYIWAIVCGFLLISTCSGIIVYCVRAVDGDTIVVSNGTGLEKVRLIGVDTPETKHPTKPIDPFGYISWKATTSAVFNSWVVLEFDGEPKRDRYGRLLAYVWVHELFLNAELVRYGYGVAYTRFPFSYKRDFIELEDEARSYHRGLWGLPDREQ